MITITDAAVDRIKDMMKEEGDDSLLLRVGVKGGGCSGLSYGMGFDKEVSDEDKTFEKSGLNVVVDNESAGILEGVVIDYKENMMGGGFTIENPNAVATCGCGSSFRTAENAGTPEDC
ncbi:iron-sulfur cluster insertion protein ErpA [Desertibacillus haloalkaliphilus]|uniref:iron-sulfur cluster insertion protein ErpA n=1 Tax=Desertibacillus haloalkaliphilus TaxID=1328930 RepID=UPI001C275B86|nr:iron-sulfur cluster insertion protein ErpA [Desertibacillus haloalkaliphilus]MBU8905389.1 iron-sulfur cluster insertion protein ErpA [Desertibacillus haloalkaliphilus]